MIKIPVMDIKLDIENLELYDKYFELIKNSDIKYVYVGGDIKGSRELTNNYFFRAVPGKDGNDAFFYCDDLAIYFEASDKYQPAPSYEVMSTSIVRSDKYRDFFTSIGEITLEDERLNAERNLLLLRQGKTFTR